MNESTSDQPPGQNISRRDFIKRAAQAVGGLAVGEFASKEYAAAKDGIFTIDGVDYVPLYEDHRFGPPKDSLPPDTDVVFIESNFSRLTYSSEGQQILLKRETLYSMPDYDVLQFLKTFENKIVPGREDYLQIAQENNAKIAIGDVGLTNNIHFLEKYPIPIRSKEDSSKFYLGIITTLAAFLPANYVKSLQHIAQELSSPQDDQIESSTPFQTKMGRKAFIGTMMRTAVALLGIKNIASTAELPTVLFGDTATEFNRFFMRLYGLILHFKTQPSQYNIFTRNALMALKIKTLGLHEKQNGDDNNNPKIAFNAGAAHSGIEDFLYLPLDALRALVAYLHTEWVDDVLDIIGPEDFCTTRVFEFADDSEHLVDVDRIIDSELLPMLLNRRTWIVSSAKAK